MCAVEPSPSYWITPVRSKKQKSAEELIRTLVGEEQIYALGQTTPRTHDLQPSDWICFYATRNGIVAHAKLLSSAQRITHPKVPDADKYPWLVHLEKTRLYLHNPVVLDSSLRCQLDAFSNRDVDKIWSWFVQTTHKITQHDFEILTRR